MRFRRSIALFLILLAIEIFAGLTENLSLQFFSKPLLVPALILYFLTGKRSARKSSNLVLAALIFSWLGDVILLYSKVTGRYFVAGLIAFLTAHFCYIWFFFVVRRENGIKDLPRPLVLIGIFSYTVALFGLLAPYVADLLIPVAVYALTISTMLAASVAAFDVKLHRGAKYCITGAAFFVISDTLLAINRFAVPFSFAHALVMLTYATAQFLIVEGSLQWFTGQNKNAEV